MSPLDGDLAREAAELAARHRLRGSDAVYVAVARRGRRPHPPARTGLTLWHLGESRLQPVYISWLKSG